MDASRNSPRVTRFQSPIRCCRSGRHSNEAAVPRLSQPGGASMLQRANSQRPSTSGHSTSSSTRPTSRSLLCPTRTGAPRGISVRARVWNSVLQERFAGSPFISIVRVDDLAELEDGLVGHRLAQAGGLGLAARSASRAARCARKSSSTVFGPPDGGSRNATSCPAVT